MLLDTLTDTPTETLTDTLTGPPIAEPEPRGAGIDEDLRGLGEDPCLIEELLVEEISIDGMCGVY